MTQSGLIEDHKGAPERTRRELWTLLNRLDALPTQPIRRNCEPANQLSMENTRGWLRNFYFLCEDESLRWIEPHLTTDEHGDISVEWSMGKKGINVTITPQSIYAFKSCGPDLNTEMADVDLENELQSTDAWKWLLGR